MASVCAICIRRVPTQVRDAIARLAAGHRQSANAWLLKTLMEAVRPHVERPLAPEPAGPAWSDEQVWAAAVEIEPELADVLEGLAAERSDHRVTAEAIRAWAVQTTAEPGGA